MVKLFIELLRLTDKHFTLKGGVGAVWAVSWLCCIHDSPSVCPGLCDKEKEIFGINRQAQAVPHRTNPVSNEVLASMRQIFRNGQQC